jgi:hypothetical protein
VSDLRVQKKLVYRALMQDGKALQTGTTFLGIQNLLSILTNFANQEEKQGVCFGVRAWGVQLI